MKEYLIAASREHREALSEDWRTAIRHLDDVEIISEDERLQMIRVRAPGSAIESIRKRFGDWLHIEEPSDHETRE